ncbi:MAG: universal stress protein [Patulibacter sp.]
MLNGPLLIAYDGSDNASHAISVAGQLLGHGLNAEVVHAWEPGAGGRRVLTAIATEGTGGVDAELQHAEAVARQGVVLAQAAGFIATGHARSGNRPAWATIVDAAEVIGASMIIMGTRGLTGVRAAVVGSVSHHVTQHSPCAVLTVPLAKQ